MRRGTPHFSVPERQYRAIRALSLLDTDDLVESVLRCYYADTPLGEHTSIRVVTVISKVQDLK